MGGTDHQIAAVLFDFGGVLLQHTDGIDHAAIESRLELAPGTLRRCLYSQSRYAEAFVGACTTDEWLASVRAAMERLAGEKAAALYRAFQEVKHPLNPDVIELVGRLRPRYKTGVISNTIPGLAPRLRNEFGIAEMFDVLVGSGDLRVAKPDAAIYLYAAAELGLAPERCLFIDDAEPLAQGARAVGMRALRFTSCPQLVADLRSAGVQW
ncbi:MAG TPA: HAD family phosphatase [Dehalococcoidia bacterium]|nr:HAD family phosphatase [Dehalococcoidia bacterium]